MIWLCPMREVLETLGLSNVSRLLSLSADSESVAGVMEEEA